MITHLEEFSMNAWPALQTLLYDGWVIRFANGYTRRANSINPLYASSLDLEEKFRYCEALFQTQKLPLVFKITPAVFPGDLDHRLQARGYRREAEAQVQVLDLQTEKFRPAPGVTLQENLTDEWLDGFCRMSQVNPQRQETLRRMLNNLVARRCFASIKSESQPIACGMGVLQEGTLGLFEIVTDQAFRQRGFGRQVVESLLGWGRQNAAQQAYLQVMCQNAPALELYAKLGFIESYTYWYRVRS